MTNKAMCLFCFALTLGLVSTGYGEAVVVGDFEGYLQWYDLSTGDLQARVKAGSDRITSQPLVVNDLLYVMNDGGKLFAYSIVPPKQGD